jgi:hypothetical protein
MKFNASTLSGMVLLVLLFFMNKSGPGPLDVDPAPVPSAALQRLMQPLRDELAGHDDGSAKARKVAAFYRDFTSVLSADNASIVNNTALLRDAHLNGLRLLDASDEPPIGCHINEALKNQLGLDNVAIDQDKLRTILDLMRAFCWAAEQES